MLPGQLELPDCEPRPADMLHRKAQQPLKPAKPQLPCDHGMFSDGVDQIDLEEILS